MQIIFTSGDKQFAETLEQALGIIREKWPLAAAYDSGGFEVNTDGDRQDGSRVLVWENETDSENDDGSKALAEIRDDGDNN